MKIKIIKILIIIAYIFLVISCKREKETVLHQEEKADISSEYSSKNSENSDSKSNEKSNDDQAITLASAESPQQASQRNRIIVGSNYHLLYEQNIDIVTPEDFEIGPLIVFSTKAGDEAQNKAYRDFINRFFYELRKENIPSAMIWDENIFFLTNIFTSYIEKKQIPDTIRIGKVITTKDGLRLNLRMFKGKNRTEGEIILLKTKKSFQVKEFYGDLGMLDVEYTKSNEKFEPEIYKF